MNDSTRRGLSVRQRQVLNELAGGHTYHQIAERMGVSIHTVRNHVRRIYLKLGVKKSAEAVAKDPGSPALA